MRNKDELIAAMGREIEKERNYTGGEIINTIYFGGGTPSLMEIADLQFLVANIRTHYRVASDAEITLEANPDDISEEKLEAWKRIGFNRLSIGVQSFFEEELRWMNRAHTAEQAINNLQLAIRHFDNITADLIYGSPLLTDEMWQQNVERIISMNIPHLSCYALTVEEKTPLHKQILRNKSKNVEDEKQARQFLLLMNWLKEAGYEHYEVSNFAKPGFRSRHNSAYWRGEKYLGIGPSAHSFNGLERRWNIANNKVYINSTKDGNAKRETEILSEIQMLNEFIMISLRTVEGLNLEVIEQKWGGTKKHAMEKQLQQYAHHGLVLLNGSIARLTDEGMLRADGIAAELFTVA